MKLSRITIILALVQMAFVAHAGLPELVPQYKIISDTLDESVPKGTCRITGVVFYNQKPAGKAVVKAYNYDMATGISDLTEIKNATKGGEFRLNIDTSTYYLTAWKPGTGIAYLEGIKFKSQHHIVMEIYLPDEMVETIVEKPVVYLYNHYATKDVLVQVETDMDMTFTYPKMEEGNNWNVKVDKDGIRTKDGRSYPYLFWEAASADQEFYDRVEGKISGNIVQTDTVIDFLENKLYGLHLSPKEVADFITYWGPRLQQKPYAVVQFKVDQEVDQIAALKITPQPDWVRRVYMVYTGFNEEPNMPLGDPYPIEEVLMKRQGFYAIEWGGAEISLIKL